MKMRRCVALLSILSSIAGCTIDIPPVRNADLTGTWTLNLRNGPNGCGFGTWEEGAVNPVEITFTHAPGNDGEITGKLTGLLAFLIGVGLGSSEFRGSIDGRDIEMDLHSDNQLQGPGTCMYNVRLRATAIADGTTLRMGKIRYSPFATNGSADCDALTGCETVQTFEGLRTGDLPAPPDGGRR